MGCSQSSEVATHQVVTTGHGHRYPTKEEMININNKVAKQMLSGQGAEPRPPHL